MSETTKRSTASAATSARRGEAERAMMRAAVARRFGPPEVVAIEQVRKPVPKPGEVLVRVHAFTVDVADHRLRARDFPAGFTLIAPLMFGVFRPRKKILGTYAAGVVEAVGAEVTEYGPGDEVLAMRGITMGAHAEYVVVLERRVVPKPAELSFDDAVSVMFGGDTAWAFLETVTIEPGTEVLVNGASGAVGVSAVQLAKLRGARVTAVTSGRNADLLRSLGADRVVDYTRDDFAADDARYDVIVEAVGNAGLDRAARVLKPGGALLLVVTDLSGVISAKRRAARRGFVATAAGAKTGMEGVAEIARLAASGEYRPVVDRVFDLDEIVDAHRYVDTGRKRGSVVVRVP